MAAARAKLLRITLLLAALVALAGLSGCVYPNIRIADPGMVAFGNDYLMVGTDGSTLPIYAIHKSDLQNPTSARATQVGSVFSPGQLSGSWINTGCGADCGLWAPELKPIGGRNVIYFSARCNGGTACGGSTQRCIGMATGVSGGYALDPKPFCNPQNFYGLIDPTEFSYGGANYLLFKRDVPHGTATKSIAITRLDGGGLNPTLPTTTLLTPTQGWERSGWASVEAPTMIQRGGYFYLLYSGNLYSTDNYGIGVARCPTSFGSPVNCGTTFDSRKYGGNPIVSGDSAGAGYCGTGHSDVTDDGGVLWYHTYLTQVSGSEKCFSDPTNPPPRYLGAQTLSWDSGWPLPASRNP